MAEVILKNVNIRHREDQERFNRIGFARCLVSANGTVERGCVRRTG